MAPAVVHATLWAAGGRGLAAFNGVRLDDTVEAFAEECVEYAEAVVPKGEGVCFSLGLSSDGRHTDASCEGVWGLLLDSDHSGDFEPLKAVLDADGVAYLIQRRGEKFHASLFFDASVLLPNKVSHRATFRHVIDSFSAATGIRFDASQADSRLPITFSYTKRTPEEIVETHFAEGEALNFEALLAATGFDASKLSQTPDAPELEPSEVPEAERLDAYTTKARIVEGCARYRRDPKIARYLSAFLKGGVLAHENRDIAARDLTATITTFTGGCGNFDAIMEMLLPTLEATQAAYPNTKLTEEKLMRFVDTGLRSAYVKAQSRAARDAAIQRAITSPRRNVEPDAATMKLFSKPRNHPTL